MPILTRRVVGAVLAVLGLQVVAHSACAATLEPVIVTASLTGASPELLGGAHLSSDVLSREQPFSALEVLDGRAGIRAFGKGGAGGGSYLSIRGGEPNYTMVLLEGARLNDPTNSQGGAFDFGLIDPALLEGIDVYRGALSALYGSDALSGVVDLRLRQVQPGQRFMSARVGADTRGGSSASASLGAGSATGTVLAGAGYSDAGEATPASTRTRWHLVAQGTQEFAGVRIAALLLHAHGDRHDFPEDSGGERLAVNRRHEASSGRLDLQSLELSGAQWTWHPRLRASWSRQQSDTDTPAIASGVLDGVPAIKAATDFRRSDVQADAIVPIDPTWSAGFGASISSERGLGRGSVDVGFPLPARFDIERSATGSFLELTRQSPRALLVAGIRRDAPSTNAARWNGRMSARVQVRDTGPAIYANWSQGYKLPSLYALAYPLIANPALRPERNQSLEFGLQQDRDQQSYRVAWFENRFRDVIDFDPALFTNVNRASVLVRGAEGEWRRAVSSELTLTADGTYTDTDAGGIRLRFRPRWQGGLRLDLRVSAEWALWSRAALTGSYYDSSVPTGLVEQSGFARLDVGAERRQGAWRVTLAVRNLAGRRYEETVGSPAAGTTLQGSIAMLR